MIDESEQPHAGPFGHAYDENYECEFCDRSVIARFGGVPSVECPACRDEFAILVSRSGGMIETVDA